MALLPPAAFAVHQLRYELAYGSAAGRELHETGHSYLHSVVPWLVLLIALAVGCFLRRIGQAFARHSTPRAFTLSFTATWGLCAAALVAIFACQETLEGFFATGHPGGLEAVFGFGGWWAIPIAICIGQVLAAVFHGARWVVGAVARTRRSNARPWCASVDPSWPTPRPDATAPAPWLGGRSSRGPPRGLRLLQQMS